MQLEPKVKKTIKIKTNTVVIYYTKESADSRIYGYALLDSGITDIKEMDTDPEESLRFETNHGVVEVGYKKKIVIGVSTLTLLKEDHKRRSDKFPWSIDYYYDNGPVKEVVIEKPTKGKSYRISFLGSRKKNITHLFPLYRLRIKFQYSKTDIRDSYLKRVFDNKVKITRR